MMEALLSIAMPCSWVYSVAKDRDVRIQLLDTVKGEDGMTHDLAEINLRDVPAEPVIEAIKRAEHVKSVEVTKHDKGRLIAIVKTEGCEGCVALASADVFLLSAHTTEEKRLEWKIAFSKRKDLDLLISKLQAAKADVAVLRVSNALDDGLHLTDRQLKIVEVAFKRGYYDYPKRVSIRELARIFQVSTATVSEILRRGQRKIIKDHLEGRKRF
jgi:predicted DNA binding protein